MKKAFIFLILSLLLTVGAFGQATKRIDYQTVTTVDIGSVPSAVRPYVTVSERGIGVIHKTTFTFTNMPVSVLDTPQGGGVQVYSWPEGRIFILGGTGSATFTTSTAIASTLNSGVSCRWGLGTVTQSNATLATTEQDLLPVTTFTSSTTINVVNTATNSALAAAAQFDGTATAKVAFFNISVPTATDIDADSTVLVNGSITIAWIQLGDY